MPEETWIILKGRNRPLIFMVILFSLLLAFFFYDLLNLYEIIGGKYLPTDVRMMWTRLDIFFICLIIPFLTITLSGLRPKYYIDSEKIFIHVGYWAAASILFDNIKNIEKNISLLKLKDPQYF